MITKGTTYSFADTLIAAVNELSVEASANRDAGPPSANRVYRLKGASRSTRRPSISARREQAAEKSCIHLRLYGLNRSYSDQKLYRIEQIEKRVLAVLTQEVARVATQKSEAQAFRSNEVPTSRSIPTGAILHSRSDAQQYRLQGHASNQSRKKRDREMLAPIPGRERNWFGLDQP